MNLIQWRQSKVIPNKFYIEGTNQFLDLFITLDSKEEENIHRGIKKASCKLYEELQPFIDKTQPVIIEGYSMGASILIELSRILRKEGYEGSYIAKAPYPIYTKKIKAYVDLTILINKGDWVPKLFPEYSFPVDAKIEYDGEELESYQLIKKWNTHIKGYGKWK